MMMTKTVITIGFNDKDTKFQLYPDRFYYNKIDELLKLNNIEAATLVKCEGYYKGKKENSMQVILLNTLNIQGFIKDIKEHLNQECVMVEYQEIQCNFI